MQASYDENYDTKFYERLDNNEKYIDCFRKNISLIRRYLPNLYEDFKLYQLKGKLIKKTEQIYFINEATQSYVSAMSIEEAHTTVVKFHNNPNRLRVHLQQKFSSMAPDFQHIQYLKCFDHWLQEIECSNMSESKISIQPLFIIMLGIGIDSQCSELISQLDVQHLLLYEPDRDLFFASLYLLDWDVIIKHSQQSGHSLTILVGGKEELLLKVSKLVNLFGSSLLADTYIYKQRHDTLIKETWSFLKENAHQWTYGWGFLEDEVLGLKHTIENLNAQTKFLQTSSKLNERWSKIPVVLVGNGASLDQSFQQLIEHRENWVIICCGASTLKSLHHYQITPDGFVMMERLDEMAQWIDEIDDPEYLKKITLFGLNTISQKIINFFIDYGLALKSADLGAVWLTLLCQDMKQSVLPMAANAGVHSALSLLIHLGVKTCYFIGVDLGYKDMEKHHSVKSGYYTEKMGVARYPQQGLSIYKRVGNFGGSFFTDSVFDMSRCMIETLLRVHNKDIQCFNLSDGVNICGASPLKPHDLNLRCENGSGRSWSQQVLNKTFSCCKFFETDGFDKIIEKYSLELFRQSSQLVSQWIDEFPESPQPPCYLHQIFTRQNAQLFSLSNEFAPAIQIMWSGTLNFLHWVMITALINAQEADILEIVWIQGKKHWVEFLSANKKYLEDILI